MRDMYYYITRCHTINSPGYTDILNYSVMTANMLFMKGDIYMKISN